MIEVRQQGAHLSVAFNDWTVLHHSPERPCLGLGTGRGRFKMRHGSFTIREGAVQNLPLEPPTVAQSGPERAELRFGDRVRLGFSEVEGRLELTLSAPEQVNRVVLHLAATPGEHLYGCGEQYSRLDLKGQRVPLWVEEQGVGRGKDLITLLANLAAGAGGDWYTTYFPQPSFVSSAGYLCHVDSDCYAVFDFRRPERHTLVLWQLPRRVVLAAGPQERLLEQMGQLVGRQPALPEWAYDGLWLGVQGGSEEVQAKLDRALGAGIKVAAVWAQDWVGKKTMAFGKQVFWDWRYNPEMYPELPQTIERWRGQGIRFLGYINSFLDPAGEHYREARERGFLVRRRSGEPYHVHVTTFPVGLVDLSNPEAYAWIKQIIKDNLLGIGASGWMADFGEHLPTDAVLHSGESAEAYHSRYPVVWARLNHEALAEQGALDDALFFTRSGFTGTARYSPLVWAGDQLTNWSLDDGLGTVIPAALSLGLSGIGLFHSDIGGYTSVAWIKRSKELFLRWAELSAFTAVMRTHEGINPRANWQFDSDPETLAHLARMVRVHCALKGYLLHAADQYRQSGLPLWRHPALHYPDEPELHRQQYQALLGRDLLLAPVTRPRHQRWRVLLPRDSWVHLWSGRRHEGGWHEVPAPLGQPPVFYRAQSEWADALRGLGQL